MNVTPLPSENPGSNASIRSSVTRRQFLSGATAATVAVGVGTRLVGAEAQGERTAAMGEVPRRAMGRTGEKVSIIGLGGFHIGTQATEAESIRIMRTALDEGVNFLDNCWDYNEGKSEIRMGKALRDGYRARAFLMTKIDGRTREVAERQINESLQRLQTDHIDLLQLHEIIRDSDPGRIFGAGGAMEALLEARKAGKIRYIGFTGHKSPEIHLLMLETARKHQFTFDAVQMPLNVMDAHFSSFEKRVLPLLTEQQIGVLGMKPLGSGSILKSNTVSATDCLHYAMGLPTSVVITGCDSLAVLRQALEAARTFRPMDPERRAKLLALTADAAKKGEFELYKTSERFDATSRNPDWLG